MAQDLLYTLRAQAEDMARANQSIALWLKSSSGQRFREADVAPEEAIALLSEAAAFTKETDAVVSLPPGTLVDHFRVVSVLGRGGMGDVYLARDTVLGRPVALKLLRGGAASAEEQEQFIQEARHTAAFSHPNIVVLYASGLHEGRPYLALEYLPGESLAARGQRRKTSVKDALSWMREVAEALSAAHEAGLVHCDVKPANIVLGSDARARLLDFGLAMWTSTGAAGGTPAYMAPERWWGGEAKMTADIWSLGVTLYEQVFGKLPFTESDVVAHFGGRPLELKFERGSADADLEQLLRDCLAIDPERRPSARDVVLRIERLTNPNFALESEVSPFRGLERFNQEHARLFFGRETETALLHEHVLQWPVTTVVGLSGAGKSSLLRAGLIPALSEDDRWAVVDVRPGAEPLKTLLGAVQASGIRIDGSQIRDPRHLNLALDTHAQTENTDVLLVVDQLEELFTHGHSDSDIDAFLALVSGATDIASPRVRVVCTIRDDYYFRLASSSSASIFLEGAFHLRAPDAAALQRALTEPLRLTGYRFKPPELVTEVVQQVSEHAAGLPLLQVACTALWNKRDPQSRTLNATAFEELGGVSGSLASHAEAVFHGMGPRDIEGARALLVSLLNPDGTRRSVKAEEVVSRCSQDVLQRLVDRRLVIPSRNVETQETTVELVHESLAQQWPRLREWIRADKDTTRLEADIREAATLWKRRGAVEDDVWSGRALEAIEHRIEVLEPDLSQPEVAEFLAKSRSYDAGVKRRRRRRATAGTVALGAVAAAAITAAVIFRKQTQTINSAAANLGRFELELRFFDLDPKTHEESAVPVSELPQVTFRLLEPLRDDPSQPGEPVDSRFVSVETATSSDEVLRHVVNARGAPAFVEVSGRGRGRACAPSIVKLQWLPGHAERDRAERHVVKLWIPSCSASLDLMKEVPGGPYISGGPGEPPTKFESYIDPEVVIDLPTYWLDETEVSNQEFAVFARMAKHTGIRMPSYPKSEKFFERLDYPDSPVGQVTYAAAEAYCRFVGKRLPSSEEWEKAARGGVELSEGVKNPYPKRNVPWGLGPEGPVNIHGDEDGYLSVAPVFGSEEGWGPYRHLNLAGNVAEWTLSMPKDEDNSDYRVVRGGNWASELELQDWTIAYSNKRSSHAADLGLGIRCSLGG